MKLKDTRRPVPVADRIGVRFPRYFTAKLESGKTPYDEVGLILHTPPRAEHAQALRSLSFDAIPILVEFLTDYDLGSDAAYAFGASIFFLSYAALEVPSNLILHRIGARLWLARIMVSWGLVSAAMALAHGPAMFYALRFLLGAAEAGTFWEPLSSSRSPSRSTTSSRNGSRDASRYCKWQSTSMLGCSLSTSFGLANTFSRNVPGTIRRDTSR